MKAIDKCSSFHNTHGVFNLMESSINKSIGLFVFIAVLACQAVYAATIRVPQDQATIQAGIDAAVDGDTILLDDGVYRGAGNLDIWVEKKSLVVKSVNGYVSTIIDGMGLGGTWFSCRDGCNLSFEGLTIENGFSNAIYVNSSDDERPTRVEVKNCLIKKFILLFSRPR